MPKQPKTNTAEMDTNESPAEGRASSPHSSHFLFSMNCCTQELFIPVPPCNEAPNPPFDPNMSPSNGWLNHSAGTDFTSTLSLGGKEKER